MRILIVTSSLPYPLVSGGAIRTFGIVQGLAEAGHELTLLSFYDGEIAPDQMPLSAYCTQIITLPPPQRTKQQRLRTLLFTSKADIEMRFYSLQFHQKLVELMETQSFDLVQFEAIESACYLTLVRQKFPNAKICFDTFNAEAELQRVIYEIDRQSVKTLPKALYSYVQSKRIYQYEGELCRLSDCVLTVSDEDAEFLKKYSGVEAVFVVPSGIIVDDYQKTSEMVALKHPALVFTGKMDYRPNVDAILWFASEIFPSIQNAVDGIQLYVVGQKPSASIQALGEIQNIHVTGRIPSVLPYLQATDLYIAPLRMGSGTRLKILEAMASGCAIVATSLATAGLISEMKTTLSIVDTSQQFAQTIINLLQQPEQRRTMAQQSQVVVRQYYDWSVLIPRLLRAYKEIGLG